MRVYGSTDVRNVALVGHSHCGKTSLVSAMLRAAKMPVDVVGSENGAAVTAYDEEEIARHMTMSNAAAFAEWKTAKLNLLDTPGFHMFLHEARAALLPVETAVVVVNAQTGVEPVTEKVWNYAAEANLPRVVVITQMDQPKAEAADGCQKLLEVMQSRWGRQVVPVQMPIVDEQGLRGVIDLVTMEAFIYPVGGEGRGQAGKIPAAMMERTKTAHEALVELVAEGNDELMEEFFAVGTIPEEHLISALHEAIREDKIFPVLYASGLRNVGADLLLSFLERYSPSAAERIEPLAKSMNGDAAAKNGGGTGADTEPLALYVYKTLMDPFAGKISFFRVLRGRVKSDAVVENYTRGEAEKLTHLNVMQGRNPIEVTELRAGDLGAVSKLHVTQTGDTLGAKGHPVQVTPIPIPEPPMTYAIEPKTRADEDKLAPSLHKLMEEDLLLRFYRDPQTNEFLLAGAGQPHIESVVSKLKRRYRTEVILKAPRVPYRETIRAKAEGHGRHKKQTGGHGQFGDCKLRVEPLPRGAGIEFVNDIFGGAIPRQFIPAVEKGVREATERGYLAGFPVVDFRVTLVDGSYHDVDSSEIAFKLAGKAAFRSCMEHAKPVLLEPVMRVEIEAPEVFSGALLGDLNGRRGRVQGMDSNGKETVVRADVPMAEVLSYGTILTSLTQGRGNFRMEMDHYAIVPTPLAEKIIAGAKQPPVE